MREFKSLNQENLPDGFDAEIYGVEPIVNVEESKGKIEVSYTFPGFYLSEDNINVEGKKLSFKQVNITATGFLSESGKPLLPSFGRYVQIPLNSEYIFTVKKGKTIEFEKILVSPAQQNITDSPDEKHKVEYEKEFYEKDAFGPEEIVKVTGPYNIDDYQALLIHVCPFQYNPAKKKLIGYSNISITIEVSLNENDSDEYRFSDPRLNREAYGNFFINPGRSIEERLELIPNRLVIHPFFWKRGPEFRIIYYNEFKKAAEKLAKWKNMRGLQTEITSINTIGNSVNEIKTFIRNERKRFFSRLGYVLLLGDVDMITPEDVSGGPWGTNITDYYYSTKNDPTAGSNTDYKFPWLSIGRIPVRKLAEAQDVVDQIISYEKSPPLDSQYYERMAFAAYFQDLDNNDKADRGYMKTMEEIREHMLTLGFDVERIYVSDSNSPQEYKDGTIVPQDVRNAIVDGNTATNMLIDATSDGQLLVGHRDHGSETGWVHPSFELNDLDNIIGNVPTPFFSLNCQTGHFDRTAPKECFAEKILRINTAAPSLIAPTRSSHSVLNDELMKALFDAAWGGVLPTFPNGTASYSVRHNRLGDILNYGKSYLPIVSTDGYYIKDHMEIYHVEGDPTLQLWKEEPLRVRIQAFLRYGYLIIRLSPCPKDSVLTIWLKDNMVKRIEPSSTHIKVALRDFGLKHSLLGYPIRPELFVCFWAPGYRFSKIRARVYAKPPIFPI